MEIFASNLLQLLKNISFVNFHPFLKYEKWVVFICLDCKVKHDAEVGGGQPSSLFPAWSSFGCKCSFNSALNCEKRHLYTPHVLKRDAAADRSTSKKVV